MRWNKVSACTHSQILSGKVWRQKYIQEGVNQPDSCFMLRRGNNKKAMMMMIVMVVVVVSSHHGFVLHHSR